ncbi:hypothetical protein Ga0466249_002782 [Sporomusaceae bacterium BoRhaA]|nr:hypothetical protein [Pelorhabdus rhamnosifermentans]
MKRKSIYFVGKVSELRKLIRDKKIINQVAS